MNPLRNPQVISRHFYISWTYMQNFIYLHIFLGLGHRTCIRLSIETQRLKNHCVCAQLYPTLCKLMDSSPPGSSVHATFPARILEWAAISSSGGSSQARDWIHISWVSCIAGRLFTAEPPRKPNIFLGYDPLPLERYWASLVEGIHPPCSLQGRKWWELCF